MNTFLKHLFGLWILWILLATLLGWLGIFYMQIFWIFLGSSFFWILKNHLKTFRKPSRPSLYTFIFWGFISFFVILNTFVFFQPQTLFNGRDQGSLSQASYFLSKYSSFSFPLEEAKSFFSTYGEGKALNFPGFFYDATGNLITQFPHPTIAWYASLLSLGIPSPYHIIIGNALTLFFFIFSFWKILLHFTNKKISSIFTVLILITFPLWWFSRFSLTENVMLASLWITLFFLLNCTQKSSLKNILILFLSLSLLSITRIEGVFFSFLILISLFFFPVTQKFLREKILFRFFIPSLVFLLFFSLAVFNNLPFYSTVTKAFLETLGFLESLPSQETTPSLSLLGLWKILFLYGIGSLALLSLFSFMFIFFKKNIPKRQSFFLILSILSPSFIYFLVPFISPDHPWMLRRFLFSAIPALILIVAYAFFVIIQVSKKKQKVMIYGALFILFLSQSIPIFSFFSISQDFSLLQQTIAFSQNFTQKDIVLVEKNVTGNGFVMIPSILQMKGISSAYFFNAEDFNRADFSNFERVFFLVEKGSIDTYSDLSDNKGLIVEFSDSRLTDNILNTSLSFPNLLPYSTSNRLFLVQ
ncbi:MAG: hypothetical protein EOM19_01865 [Candidatus Moranbacteria bacterium]|nr:hypothetical protein [Candidatus Moranbacteria bacterium]